MPGNVVIMLIFEIRELIKVKKGQLCLFFFLFFDNAKKLGRSDDAKRRKKRGWPFNIVLWLPQQGFRFRPDAERNVRLFDM